MGILEYQQAWDLQRRLAIQRATDEVAETLLLLEHAAVYTAGPRAPQAHILAELPAPLVQTDRGGQVTYHGPGQLVGYPIIDLRAKGLGPKAYVQALEAAIVDALAGFGVAAHTEAGPGLTGVWSARGKIAAIGVKISRGVTLHGFALNGVTLGPRRFLMADGNPATQAFYESLGVTCITADVSELSRASGAIGCLTGILARETPA